MHGNIGLIKTRKQNTLKNFAESSAKQIKTKAMTKMRENQREVKRYQGESYASA